MKEENFVFLKLEREVIRIFLEFGANPRDADESSVLLKAVMKLNETDFTNEFHRRIFRIISDYYREENVFPSPVTVREIAELFEANDMQVEIFSSPKEADWDSEKFANCVSMLKVITGYRTTIDRAESEIKKIEKGIRNQEWLYFANPQKWDEETEKA